MTATKETPPPSQPSRAPMSGRAIVQNQFDRAADLINLEAYMRKILMSPFREVQVEVPVRMDDGRIEVLTGDRIEHKGARAPGRRAPAPPPRRRRAGRAGRPCAPAPGPPTMACRPSRRS